MGKQADLDQRMAPALGPVRPDIQNFRRIWVENPRNAINALQAEFESRESRGAI
jgi:hypothetical protein